MSPHLSFDIQVQIIQRLPVKSLVQFRSVCKTWKSLIDSCQFIAGYNIRRDQPQHLMIRYEVGDVQEPEVKYVCFVDDDSFPQQNFALTVPPLVRITRLMACFRGPELSCSSHGLFCLAGYFQGPEVFKGQKMAVLWNPSIRKSIAVVVPHVVHPPFSYVLGFGVCPDTKDPKLVKITYINDYKKMESISCIPRQVMVFTLSSGEWTCLCSNQLPRKSIQFEDGSQVVIGQFIYWLVCDWIAVDKEHINLIMSFDLSTEEFREIDLPNDLAFQDLSISRLRESLVVVAYDIMCYGRGFTTKQRCDIWMMEHGDSKAFTKLFTINPPNASVSRTLGFRNIGEPIVEMVFDNKDICTLIVYEPCLEHIKDLGICGNRFSFFGSSYTESLLLLDHEDGHIVRCGAVKS